MERWVLVILPAQVQRLHCKPKDVSQSLWEVATGKHLCYSLIFLLVCFTGGGLQPVDITVECLSDFKLCFAPRQVTGEFVSFLLCVVTVPTVLRWLSWERHSVGRSGPFVFNSWNRVGTSGLVHCEVFQTHIAAWLMSLLKSHQPYCPPWLELKHSVSFRVTVVAF